MKIEDAKAIFLLEHCAERCDGYQKDDTCENCEINAAIEALEKHIPIRPIMRIEEKGFNKGCIYPHCPICDTMPLPHPNVSYCDKCGQAIDWSESE